MKQSSCSASLLANLTKDEIEVSEILLQLPHLISESESLPRFSFEWGAKRRRSALASNPSILRFRLTLSSSALRHGTCGGGGSVAGPSCETEGGPPAVKVKAEASSPATPLSFSPSSESDEKPKSHLKRKVQVKRKREEWLEIIDGLTQRRDLLKGEVENVKRYHDKLKAFNLELKTRKQEFSLGLTMENPHLENNKSIVKSPAPENQNHHQQRQLIMDQAVQRSEIGENFENLSSKMSILPSSNGVGMVNNNVGPLGIPDLNFSPDECVGMDSSQPFDLNLTNKNLSRAMAAQARQRRIQIYRVKNSIAASKLRFTYNR